MAADRREEPGERVGRGGGVVPGSSVSRHGGDRPLAREDGRAAARSHRRSHRFPTQSNGVARRHRPVSRWALSRPGALTAGERLVIAPIRLARGRLIFVGMNTSSEEHGLVCVACGATMAPGHDDGQRAPTYLTRSRHSGKIPTGRARAQKCGTGLTPSRPPAVATATTPRAALAALVSILTIRPCATR